MKLSLRVFLDEGVARSVGCAFSDAGHEVIYLHEAIRCGSPDELVAVAAQANDAILVACDGDMRIMAHKYGVSNTRYKDLSLIKFTLKNQVRAASRLKQAMSLIEHEWAHSEGKRSRRMFIEIKDAAISTKR